ncbi:hypothetical protein [Konateibacter massiliensis]|uniref:hypothetical protein n=1 Tax=Konateibacter massiliensis TaxID=2002841 RepID=UPI002F40D7EF
MAAKKTAKTFTKEQVLNSKKYIHRKDLINILLSDAETCTLTEVDKRIEQFLKGKVK